MKERLKDLRNTLHLSQQEFGTRIKITRSHVSSLESGARNVTDRIISDICREFNINENWLRAGQGNMFVQKTEDEELAEYSAEITLGDDEFIKGFIKKYMKLSEANKQIVRDLFK